MYPRLLTTKNFPRSLRPVRRTNVFLFSLEKCQFSWLYVNNFLGMKHLTPWIDYLFYTFRAQSLEIMDR